MTPPDGAGHAITFAYKGARVVTRTTKVMVSGTAETAATTTETSDGLGRLASVTEAAGPSWNYGYDITDHLTSVKAGTALRVAFGYDGRGLLTWEDMPEKTVPSPLPSWRTTDTCPNYTHDVCYAVDSRGHVRRKLDGDLFLGFTFDAYERLASVVDRPGIANKTLRSFSYFDTAIAGQRRAGKLHTSVAHNYYDGADFNSDFSITQDYAYTTTNGRISKRTTSGLLGGTLAHEHYGPSVADAFATSYTWDDLGNLASVTYPQNSAIGPIAPARTITSTYSQGALTAVPGYLSGTTYHPNGLTNVITYGSGITVTQANDPVAIARPASILTANVIDGSGQSDNFDSGTFEYDGSGNIKTMGTDTFRYDLRSRLASVSLNRPNAVTQATQYDNYGNLTKVTTTGTGVWTVPLNSSTNRLSGTGILYDNAGNLTKYGATTYAWYPTGEMRLLHLPGQDRLYGYDADGERIVWRDLLAVAEPGGAPIDKAQMGYTIRGLDGKVLREFILANHGENRSWAPGPLWMWSEDFIYRGGSLLASVSPSLGVRHFTLDHLGSPRLITDRCRLTCGKHHYFGFGQEAYAAAQADTERMKFTGHERDLQGTSGTGDDLDYMHARTYSPNFGRFLSVDPGRDVDPKVPQSWNMYAYARGNPMKYLDPNGEDVIDFINGAVNGFGSSMLGNSGRVTPINRDMAYGQALGDTWAVFAGAIEASTGASLFLGGSGGTIASGGAAAVVSVPVAVAGSAMVVQGGLGVATGVTNVVKFASGDGGTQVTSRTLLNTGGTRVDVENPNPAQRPGQVHLQRGDQKFTFDPSTGQFKNAPKSIQKLLENPHIRAAVEKGMKYLDPTWKWGKDVS